MVPAVKVAGVRVAERWSTLVRARLDEVERLSPDGGGIGPDYWDRRAARFARRFSVAGPDDPFLARLSAATEDDDVVVDVGAGPGRYALALAPWVREVVAVDPSPVMLGFLGEQAARRALDNVSCRVGDWRDVDAAGEVVVCSYVLPVIPDAAAFVRKLHAAAGRRVFVYLSAASADVLQEPFWRYFHGRRRAPAPTYLDAVDLVEEELGVDVDVEVVEAATVGRFADLGEAVDDYRDNLLLPDTPETRASLARLLEPWLVADGEVLRAPVRTMPGAILAWAAGDRAGAGSGMLASHASNDAGGQR